VILILPSRKPEAKQKKFLSESQAVNKAQAFIATDYGKVSKELFTLKKKIQTIHYGLALEDFDNPYPTQFESGLILYTP
jgi:hypothetical protein